MALKRSNRYCILLWLCFSLIPAAHAQYADSSGEITENYAQPPAYETESPVTLYTDTMQRSYEQSEPSQARLSKKDWEEITEGLHYDKDTLKKKEEEEKIEEAPKKDFDLGNIAWLKVAALVLVIAILIFIIYKMAPGLFGTANTKVKSLADVMLEELDEEEIKNLNYENLLRQALDARDYRAAFRVRYLDVIRKLTETHLIQYKKDKTNFEYLLQLSGTSVYASFRDLTLYFDTIWYGEQSITEADYLGSVPLFEKIAAEIKEEGRRQHEA